jgi:hypothetical protein
MLVSEHSRVNHTVTLGVVGESAILPCVVRPPAFKVDTEMVECNGGAEGRRIEVRSQRRLAAARLVPSLLCGVEFCILGSLSTLVIQFSSRQSVPYPAFRNC